MKIALAMIVKGSDEESVMLDRCLDNMSPYVDGIFITRTQKPKESKNRAVEDVVKKYNGILSDFGWVYDFSAARNFNFAQVPEEFDYIIWSDADDMWKGLDKLKTTVENNPNVDGFGFWYLYDWDEEKRPVVVHRKTMLVKNNGCVKWVGRVHEDLTETRQLDIKLIDGISRLHLTDSQRIQDSAERNLEIAEKANEELPDDPRSKWNLGNAQLMMAQNEEAAKTFEEFIAASNSDEEKYLAYQRLADVYKNTDIYNAIKNIQFAIGLRPEIPDAYYQTAYLYFALNDYDKAEYYAMNGLMRRPQPNKMIVYNPRDYDYNPMMLLAKVYYNKNRPDLMLPLLEGCLKIHPKDEKLKKMVRDGKKDKKILGEALEQVQKLQKIKDKDKLRVALSNLPKWMQSHPAVCVVRNTNFIKQETSGKDLVYYCGQTTQKWNPDTFKKEGIGGSEEAVIHLAREWAKDGWNVTVYNNCGHKEMKKDGVVYKPFWEFNYRDKQDVVILWRQARPVDANINANKILVDLHDVIPAAEFTPKRLEKINKVFVKSQAHRILFPNIPDEKITVVPNGFKAYPVTEKKDPNLLINTSSPDRSLDALPELFKEVKKRYPTATMKWAYGWDGFKNAHANDPKKIDWMNQTIKSLDEAGIESLGRLTQEEVGHLYEKASILAYPTEFYEIDCISVRKAQAAGCVPVTTDFAALNETNKFGIKVHSSKTQDNWAKPYQFHFGLEDIKTRQVWVDAVVSELQNPTKMEGVDEYMKDFTWSATAKKWIDVIYG